MIEKLLHKIAQSLDKKNISYMIIGGQAVLLYGSPRFTRDIDITLGVDTDKFLLIKEVCEELGLKILPEDPEDFAKETKVLPADEPESRMRVDFIFSCTTYEMLAMQRIKNVTVDDYPIKFASCEDVIIHKMFAARAIDLEDVKNILIKNRDTINLEYIRKWLIEFGQIPEQEGILEKFEALLSE